MKYGAENSLNPEKSHKAVNNFLKGIKILLISEIGDEYAKIKVKLRKQGTPMHDEFDLMIGVTALFYGLTLVTDNVKDFKYIENLKLENWFNRK